jgi:hypothetical protein
MQLLLITCALTLIPIEALDPPMWNGANVPWNNFGYDIGGGAWDASWFTTKFSMLQSAGANSIRFWLHADGRASPSFANDGSVSGPGGANFAQDLKALVSLAAAHNLVLELCLWSFDMCKQDMPGAGLHADLITDVNKTTSYINNALIPTLRALDGAPGVVIEVINEPEWCMASACNTKQVLEPI